MRVSAGLRRLFLTERVPILQVEKAVSCLLSAAAFWALIPLGLDLTGLVFSFPSFDMLLQ